MKVQIDRIARDIETINSFTATPGKGVTRFTFSEPYMQARAYVAAVKDGSFPAAEHSF